MNMKKVDIDATLESGSGFFEFFAASETTTVTGLLNTYIPVFIVAFIATLLITPLVRTLAVNGGVVDKPDDDRKLHRFPIAYLGGLAILFGVSAGLVYSYVVVAAVPAEYELVPFGVLLGLFAIAITGFMDDVWHWDPRLKIAGQLVAAAGLAISDVGVHVATGVLAPLFGSADTVLFEMGGMPILAGELYYWMGTCLIAIFVIGGCNAANLLDGLDGLLAGSTAIMAIGFLAIAIMMVVVRGEDDPVSTLAGARIVMCLVLLGAVLGFLPYNFNPAVIFLGDCGSLLIGYMCVVVILMFGELGQTHLVIAGLIIFALPIMDTVLAIVRRKLAGLSLSAPDTGHIHHMILRGLGSVKLAVMALYGITWLFTLFGVALAAVFLWGVVQGRFVYGAFLVLFSFIAAIAVKTARRKQWEREANQVDMPNEQAPAPRSKSTSEPTPVTTDKDDRTEADSGTAGI